MRRHALHMRPTTRQSEHRALGVRGFTLMEMMVGLAVTSVLTLIAVPKVQLAVDRAQVKSARAEVFNRLATARVAAQQGGRVATFRVVSGRVWTIATPRLVAVVGSSQDTLGPVVDVATLYRVTMTTSVASIIFDPTGLASGTGTIRIARGAFTDSVAVTGLGSVIR